MTQSAHWREELERLASGTAPAPVVTAPRRAAAVLSTANAQAATKPRATTAAVSEPDPLPANIVTEKALLGAILLDNAAHAEAVKAGIVTSDFELDSHRKVWLAITTMVKSSLNANIVTLSAEMEKRKQLRTVGGRAYLAGLTEDVPFHSQIGDFARIIKERSSSRDMLQLAEAIQARVEGRIDTPSEIAAQAAKDFAAIANGAVRGAAPRPDLVRLVDVQARAVSWLWEPFIPLGMLSMISGDPGGGKTFVAMALCAGVTRGKLGDGRIVEPANALYLSIENPVAETIRPRFDSLGGDPTRFFALRGTQVEIDGEEYKGSVTLSDIGMLDQAIAESGAKLVVVDPLQSYLGASVDLHRSNETRPVLDALSKLAEKHGCAILLLRHLAKQSGTKAIHRGLGSIDLTGAARSEMLVGSLPDDENTRAFVHIKSNIGRRGQSLGFAIDDEGRFSWTGNTQLTASDLLAGPETPELQGAKREAEEWLRDALSGGSRDAKELTDSAKSVGIAYRTLKRAKSALYVQSHKAAMNGGWVWSLPEDGPKDGRFEV